MMNPFLPVSDSSSTKGGAGHSLSPSLSRFKNKCSTQRQFSSQKIEHCCNTNRRSLFVQTSLSNIFHSAQPSPAKGPSLKVVHVYVLHFWILASRFFLLKVVYGHITLNTPLLVRSLKLSKVETC